MGLAGGDMPQDGRLVTKIVTVVVLLLLGLVCAWNSIQAYVAWGLGIMSGIALAAPSEFFNDWYSHGK